MCPTHSTQRLDNRPSAAAFERGAKRPLSTVRRRRAADDRGRKRRCFIGLNKAPSRAGRRRVNNSFAKKISPRRRRQKPRCAVALGHDPLRLCPRPPRRAPVEITSSREVFNISVWSVIRPCLDLQCSIRHGGARRRDTQRERIRNHYHLPEGNIPDERLGRKPVPSRRALEAVLWILNAGVQWHMLPQELQNCASALSHLVLPPSRQRCAQKRMVSMGLSTPPKKGSTSQPPQMGE
jgi:hypothetical protein